MIFLIACLSVSGQLVPNVGDSWSYGFTSLPARIDGAGPREPQGGFFFSVSAYQAGSDVLRIEMFENNLDESPLRSGLLETEHSEWIAPGAWADHSGAVRFTMLSGSVSLDHLTFISLEPSPDMTSWKLWERTLTPVPEPTVSGILLIGVILGAWQTYRRRRH